ncbi:MAG: PAS domain S-box protein [Candidatus Cloacimonetes bacterium]|nr:PAS domain S-box protein [Candidatus Cloacimonadota bacterium]
MKKARVLIVEDEKNIAEDIKISLWNLGYEVIASVTRGLKAIEKVDELLPDLILMDIELEGEMSGLEATEIIHKKHEIPIIYITSHVDQKTLDLAKITDPIGYLIKPFEEKELSVTMEMALYKYELNKLIKASEQKYRILVETIEEGIGMVDKFENFTFINRAGAMIFGFTSEELINRNIAEFTSTGEFQKLIRQTSLRKKGESSKYELVITRKDKSERIVIITASPRFVDNEYIGAFAILSDITEAKKAEENLQVIERRLTTVFNNVPNIVLYERGENRRFISENVLHLTGYSSTQFYNKDPEFLSLVHPADREIIVRKYENWCESDLKGMLTQWYRLKKADGKYIWIEDRQVKNLKENGDYFVSGVLIDNSTLKEAEEDLRESEKRYKAVVEDQTEFINRYNSDGIFTFVNGAYCRYLGKERSELIGRTWLDFFPVEKQEVVRKRLYSLTPQNPVSSYEYRKVLPNNEIRWEEWTYRAFFDENDEIIEFQSVGKDITERKIATELVVKEKNRASFFIDLLAHDINNLNHGIFSYINIMLAMGDFPGKHLKKINTCLHLSEEISDLISKVRIFSDLSDEASNLKDINLNEVVSKSIKTVILNYSKDKKIKINNELDKKNITVTANELLDTVIYNILNNAVKHNSHDEVEIDIIHKIVEKNDIFYNQIEFADNGPGIDDENKERIFNRMERVGTGKSVHGFGLGLTLVRNIVEHYGGKVWVTDRSFGEPVKGSRFVILLPQK